MEMFNIIILVLLVELDISIIDGCKEKKILRLSEKAL
jgi:hypothetical protein